MNSIREPVPGTFGARLYDRLLERGTEPRWVAFARELGVTAQQVRKYLGGEVPRMKRALDLAERLGVSVEWLLTGRGAKYPVPGSRLAQVAQAVEFYLADRGLTVPPDQRALIYAYVLDESSDAPLDERDVQRRIDSVLRVSLPHLKKQQKK